MFVHSLVLQNLIKVGLCRKIAAELRRNNVR